MKNLLLAVGAVTALMQPVYARSDNVEDSRTRPNVLIFLLDDVGFGHLGAFGGTISTPNIDRVASQGLRYTNFHTTALCSPSRAALLTGRNHHSVGFGVISEIATNEPGYTGHFPKNKWPLTQTLKEDGYHLAAFGKWHNTSLSEAGNDVPHAQRPSDLGFERFYGFLGGDMTQFEPIVYDDEKIIQPNVGRPDYHFTEDMTDQTIAWLDNWKKAGDGKPFFGFYATGAAHAPHHPPAAYANKYAGKFDQGWDKVREQVLARQKALGIMPQSTQLSPRTEEIKAWDALSDDERRLYSRMQELFAAYVEHTDAQFGRVIAKLESMGQLDNTIVIVTSDNGASGEGGLEGSFNENLFFNGIPESLEQNLARIDELGTKKAFNHYPAGWALAGNTPFKFFKQTTNEGGVADPFIVAWPKRIKDGGAIRRQYMHMNDVMPTIFDAAGLALPKTINGVEQAPQEGVSFAKTFEDPGAKSLKDHQYYEMLGNRGIWKDGWKAVAFHGRLPWDSTFPSRPFDDDVWNLYHIDSDPSETNDLALISPDKLAELKALWLKDAEKYNVFPLDDSTSGRFAKTVRDIIGDGKVFKFKEGQNGLAPIYAPTLGFSHVIEAKVTPSDKGGDGVIVANGGRFAGYALYVKEGKPVFSYNYVGLETYDIASNQPLPAGQATIKVDVKNQSDGSAKVKMFVNGNQVASGVVGKLVPATLGISDSLDIAMDRGSPVSTAYDSPFDYEGKVDEVVFTIDR